MNMKDTMILLLFFLSILGLMIGVYCADDAGSDSSLDSSEMGVYEDSDGVLTIIFEEYEKEGLNDFFT